MTKSLNAVEPTGGAGWEIDIPEPEPGEELQLAVTIRNMRGLSEQEIARLLGKISVLGAEITAVELIHTVGTAANIAKVASLGVAGFLLSHLTVEDAHLASYRGDARTLRTGWKGCPGQIGEIGVKRRGDVLEGFIVTTEGQIVEGSIQMGLQQARPRLLPKPRRHLVGPGPDCVLGVAREPAEVGLADVCPEGRTQLLDDTFEGGEDACRRPVGDGLTPGYPITATTLFGGTMKTLD
jgi:hypothetical protein